MPRGTYKVSSYIDVDKVVVDDKYGSNLVNQMIKKVMRDGKAQKATNIVYGAIERLGQELHSGLKGDEYTEKTVASFHDALKIARPRVEVKSKKIGGATLPVPTALSRKRSVAIGLTWIIKFARKRSEHSMEEKLYRELSDILQKRGSTMREKDSVNKQANANRVFGKVRVDEDED